MKNKRLWRDISVNILGRVMERYFCKYTG